MRFVSKKSRLIFWPEPWNAPFADDGSAVRAACETIELALQTRHETLLERQHGAVMFAVVMIEALVGNLLGFLSFGYGLGDLGMLLYLFGWAILLRLLVYLRKYIETGAPYYNLLLTTIMAGILSYFILSLTIWRGAENDVSPVQ